MNEMAMQPSVTSHSREQASCRAENADMAGSSSPT